jgi:non-ribosomal peptide synthetase component F
LNALRYRHTGQEEILWGYNAQVLRTELSADMTFRQLLASVQMGVQNNSSDAVSSQVTLHWRDRDPLQPILDLEGLVVEPLLTGGSALQFDRTLIVTDCGNDIRLEMEYSTDLFDAAGMARMLGHYQTLLESATHNPDQHIASLALLTPTEQSTLAEWNRTELPYPKDRLLRELIEQQVESTPDAVAVVFEERQLTSAAISRIWASDPMYWWAFASSARRRC